MENLKVGHYYKVETNYADGIDIIRVTEVNNVTFFGRVLSSNRDFTKSLQVIQKNTGEWLYSICKSITEIPQDELPCNIYEYRYDSLESELKKLGGLV